MAPWSPVVQAFNEPDHIVMTEAGEPTVVRGQMYVQRAWRCALHDDPLNPWERTHYDPDT
jgi:hypothetical protein